MGKIEELDLEIMLARLLEGEQLDQAVEGTIRIHFEQTMVEEPGIPGWRLRTR